MDIHEKPLIPVQSLNLDSNLKAALMPYEFGGSAGFTLRKRRRSASACAASSPLRGFRMETNLLMYGKRPEHKHDLKCFQGFSITMPTEL